MLCCVVLELLLPLQSLLFGDDASEKDTSSVVRLLRNIIRNLAVLNYVSMLKTVSQDEIVPLATTSAHWTSGMAACCRLARRSTSADSSALTRS